LHRSKRVLVQGAALLGCLASAGLACAQQTDPPNGLFLIAKPSLADPNFRRTVILVTQTPDASTVGVILNRPTTLDLAKLVAPGARTDNYRDAVYWGGPVLPRVVVALFSSDAPPSAPAFHVRKGFYLSMDPRNVESLLAAPDARYRLFAGFAGWLPNQLGRELARGDWYVLPVEEKVFFATDTSRLWEELVARAGETHAGTSEPRSPDIAARSWCDRDCRRGGPGPYRAAPRPTLLKRESPA